MSEAELHANPTIWNSTKVRTGGRFATPSIKDGLTPNQRGWVAAAEVDWIVMASTGRKKDGGNV